MNLHSFIVNLPSSKIRKNYMSDLLSSYDFITPHFIEAVDGRNFSKEEMDKVFDGEKSVERYGRMPNPGEKGCTLSHRKCFKLLLNSEYNYILILEDDIHPVRDLDTLKSINIDGLMNTSEPTVLFLSGDFWYLSKKMNIANVYTALGTYAYLINKAAARRILDKYPKPYNIADDWLLLKKAGIKLYAIIPYIIDANLDMNILGSDVNQYSWGIVRKNMTPPNIINSYVSGCIKIILKALGNFESKIRVINNIPIFNK